MSEREDDEKGWWVDGEMPGFAVEWHGKHGYHPVRIVDDGAVQLYPRIRGWYGYDNRQQAWNFIRRKHFPEKLRLRAEKPRKPRQWQGYPRQVWSFDEPEPQPPAAEPLKLWED